MRSRCSTRISHPVQTSGSFSDPALPSGFAPFNVQNIDGRLFVTYALKGPDGADDVSGAGNGFVDVYTPEGSLVERFASGGPLNSPWGLAVAPTSFGPFGGALLIGNNGDGHINAYTPDNGAYLGPLTDRTGAPIALAGLWGLTVGNDHLAGNAQTLFFTAGIDGEQHGLFGAIQASSAGQMDTAGTLPYDPNSGEDDYPLPPTGGPALRGDLSQAAPTPVLLPINTTLLALAPTLSILPSRAPGMTQPLLPTATTPETPTALLLPVNTTSLALAPTLSIPFDFGHGAQEPITPTVAMSSIGGPALPILLLLPGRPEPLSTPLSSAANVGPSFGRRTEDTSACKAFLDLSPPLNSSARTAGDSHWPEAASSLLGAQTDIEEESEEMSVSLSMTQDRDAEWAGHKVAETSFKVKGARTTAEGVERRSVAEFSSDGVAASRLTTFLAVSFPTRLFQFVVLILGTCLHLTHEQGDEARDDKNVSLESGGENEHFG
jgi:hypothetical protein